MESRGSNAEICFVIYDSGRAIMAAAIKKNMLLCGSQACLSRKMMIGASRIVIRLLMMNMKRFIMNESCEKLMFRACKSC